MHKHEKHLFILPGNRVMYDLALQLEGNILMVAMNPQT
jgi:hypothetical protein